MYVLRGGWLSDAQLFEFDHTIFSMVEEEVLAMDPQIRVMLESSEEAVQSCQDAHFESGAKIAVVVGQTAHEYLAVSCFHEHQLRTSRYTNTGTNGCMLSNRISRHHNWTGCSFTCDTACSSSLYALSCAVDAIDKGCEGAMAGAANTCLTPTTTISFCAAKMLSPEGRCRSFDERANGYARSEGAACMLLDRKDAAAPFGHLLGPGTLSNDGRTAGVAVPSQEAQKKMQQTALQDLEQYQISPQHISFVEAHATGTQSGDIAEGNALAKLGKSNLLVASIKSNLGHMEAASGMGGLELSGVLKACLVMKFQQLISLCPAAHETRNSRIPWDCMQPVTENVRLLEPRMVALVNSFGFGGAGAVLALGNCLEGGLVLPLKPTRNTRKRQRLIGSISERVLFPAGHPLLGQRLSLPGDSLIFRNEGFGMEVAPYLLDHQVDKQVLVPGMAMLEMCVEAGRQAFGLECLQITDVEFLAALPLEPGKLIEVVTTLRTSGSEGALELQSFAGQWKTHCRARVAPCQGEQLRRLPEHVGWKEYSGKQLYKDLESFFQLGSTFQGIQRLWHGESMQAVAEVALSEGEQHRAQQYNVHPALLDSVIQTGLGLLCVQELDFQGIPVK
ncbi:unnamed protein product, partial [Effrenium voratum]